MLFLLECIPYGRSFLSRKLFLEKEYILYILRDMKKLSFFYACFLRILIICIWVFVFYSSWYANLEIIELMPNTLDDKNLEYIVIKNNSESTKNLETYFLQDTSGKKYIFWETFLSPYQEKKFYRTQTKIILNNSWDSISLFHSWSLLVDTVSYQKSSKWKALFFHREKEEKKEDILNTQTWWILSWTWWIFLWNEDIETFPEIVISLQRPSYIYQSWSTDIYVCDGEHNECKVNFDIRGTFSSDFPEKNYRCEIQFWSGFISGQEQRCNPNTVIFPEGYFELSFKIFEKISGIAQKEKKIFIDNREDREQIIKKTETSLKTPRLQISYPHIIVQSGVDGSGSFFYCQKAKCRVNFKYEKRYTKERCYWKFGLWVRLDNPRTYLRCNPTYVEFPPGTHKLALRIYEENFWENYKELKFFVYNNFSKEIEKWGTIWEKEEGKIEKKEVQKKEEEENDFWEVNIILQGKLSQDKTLSWNTLECHNAEKCYANFTAQTYGNIAEILYSWKLDGKEFSQKKNPRGIWIYGTWSHSVSLETFLWKKKQQEKTFYISLYQKESVVDTWKYSKNKFRIENKKFIEEPLLFAEDNKKIEDSKKKSVKKHRDFTQNFLALKYDGLRISWKAPIWSKVIVYTHGEKIGEWRSNEKWRYRIVSKNFQEGSYVFDTKIIWVWWEEIFFASSGQRNIQAKDMENWFLVQKKKKTRKIKTSKTPQLIIKNYTKEEWEKFIEKPLTLFQKILFQITLLILWMFFISHISSQYFNFIKSAWNIDLLITHFSIRHKVHLIVG